MQDISQILKTRLTIFAIIIYTLLSIFTVRLIYLQLFKGSIFKDRAEKNQTRSLRIPSYRGILYDRTKELKLAYNERSLALTVIEANLPKDPIERNILFTKMSEILGEPVEQITATIRDEFIDPYTPIVIKTQISPEIISRFAEKIDEFPGIFWENRPKRVYPFNMSSFHVIGYTGIINKNEYSLLNAVDEYYLGSIIGKRGIEKQYDKNIRGNSGTLLRSVDVRGNVLQQDISKEPVQGDHLVLSIDAKLQAKAQELLQEKVGVVVISRVTTGEILVLLSTPSVDPSIFAPDSIEGKKRFQELSTDTQYPFLNRAIQGTYSPASTFKLISAAAFIKAGIDSHRKHVCTGSYQIGNRVFRCTGVHGAVDMRSAIAYSCNSYFYHFSQIVGHKPILEMAEEFGITEKTLIDLPDEKNGFLPSDAWFKKIHKRNWSQGDSANIVIGQGDVLVTPLALNQMTAVIANGGTIFRPYILKERLNLRDRSVIWSQTPEARKTVNISPETINILQEGMARVTKSGGTAGWVNNSYLQVPIAGKTGTAQTGNIKNNGLFTAYGPYGQENVSNAIAITVLLEQDRTGTAVAIAANLFNYYFGTLYPELKGKSNRRIS